MANGRNKYQSRENRAIVRGILLREWDPIGIQDIPEAADEYDRYADRVYVMLMDEAATAELIFEFLEVVASEHMGLGRSLQLAEVSRRVAEIVVGLRPDFQTH